MYKRHQINSDIQSKSMGYKEFSIGFSLTGYQDCTYPLCAVRDNTLWNGVMVPLKWKPSYYNPTPFVGTDKVLCLNTDNSYCNRNTPPENQLQNLKYKQSLAFYNWRHTAIAQKLKQYTITELLILLTCHQIVKAMLGDKVGQENEKILFSEDAICLKMINI